MKTKTKTKTRSLLAFDRCIILGASYPVPSRYPTPGVTDECVKILFLDISGPSLFLSYFEKELKENCIFHFHIMLEGFCAYLQEEPITAC